MRVYSFSHIIIFKFDIEYYCLNVVMYYIFIIYTLTSRYSKMLKSKTVSNYKADELSAIFGVRKEEEEDTKSKEEV